MNSFSVDTLRNVIHKGTRTKLKPRPCLVVPADFREILEGRFNLKLESKKKKAARKRSSIQKQRQPSIESESESRSESDPSFCLSQEAEPHTINDSAFNGGATLDMRLTEFMKILNTKESFEDPTLRASLLQQDLQSAGLTKQTTVKEHFAEDATPILTSSNTFNFVDLLKESLAKPDLMTKAAIREQLRNVKFDSKVFDIYDPEFTSEEELKAKKQERREHMTQKETVKEKARPKEKDKDNRWPTVPGETAIYSVNKIPYIRANTHNIHMKKEHVSIEKLPAFLGSQSNLDEKKTTNKYTDDILAVYSGVLSEKGKLQMKNTSALMDFRKKGLIYEAQNEKALPRTRGHQRDTSRNSKLTPNKISVKEYSLISNEKRSLRTPMVTKSTSIQHMGSNSKKSSFCAKNNEEKSTSQSRRPVFATNFKKDIGSHKFVYKPSEDSIYQASAMIQTLVKGEFKRGSQQSK
jgi:hypothetical protein